MYKGTKRREVIVDVLRKGVHQLESMDHPRLLAVIQGLVETSDTMAFATEPVLGSLANILGCLEDRLRQGIPSSLREYTFCEFEHTYGLLQVSCKHLSSLLFDSRAWNVTRRNALCAGISLMFPVLFHLTSPYDRSQKHSFTCTFRPG